MAKVMITESYLEDIADAIRAQLGGSNTYKPGQMAAAIASIGGGGTPTISSLSVTPSESIQTFNSSSVDGYKPVTVNGISSDYVGSGIARKSSTDLTASGATVSVPAGYYAEAVSKSVTTMSLPTSTAASATSGYTLKATISRSTSDQYINIAPGYNSAGGYYKISAVANGSATTPATTVTANPTISIDEDGLITASANATKSVTPTVSAGYVSSGTAGTITVSGSNTEQLTTQAAKTVAPTESEQTAVAKNVYTIGIVKVGAISSTYVGSGITSRSSTDLTASGATVTVPAGYYASQATKSVSAITLPTAASVNASTGYTLKATVTPDITDQYLNISTGYNSSNIYYKISAMTTMTLPTSASSSATSGYTSMATISRSTSDQYINIPTGYNSAGGYYKISAVANGSATGPSSLSASSATITTGTNTITLTKTSVTTTPTVSAGYVASATASTATVALTASVTVNPTPTASGATVTIPAGYYSSQTTKSVSNGSATGPSTLSGTSATVSTGTNTLTLTKTGVTTTPTVSAGYVASATASTATVTLTASVTTKAAATITPRTTNQTIASGTYLTGTQTISGDANLVAGNIISGKSIFGVSGSVVLQTVYTGSSTPSSSTGSNGDIYIQS